MIKIMYGDRKGRRYYIKKSVFCNEHAFLFTNSVYLTDGKSKMTYFLSSS